MDTEDPSFNTQRSSTVPEVAVQLSQGSSKYRPQGQSSATKAVRKAATHPSTLKNKSRTWPNDPGPGTQGRLSRAWSLGKETYTSHTEPCIFFSRITNIKRKVRGLSSASQLGMRSLLQKSSAGPSAEKDEGIASCLPNLLRDRVKGTDKSLGLEIEALACQRHMDN